MSNCCLWIFISNIITTNRNNTAIAPTYTIISEKAKKSTLCNKSKPAELTKTDIKANTEKIGLEKTTTKEANKTMLAMRKKYNVKFKSIFVYGEA